MGITLHHCHSQREDTSLNQQLIFTETTPAKSEKWTPANAPRLETATAVETALARTAPAPAARRAAVTAVHLDAANALQAACAKAKPATPAAANEDLIMFLLLFVLVI